MRGGSPVQAPLSMPLSMTADVGSLGADSHEAIRTAIDPLDPGMRLLPTKAAAPLRPSTKPVVWEGATRDAMASWLADHAGERGRAGVGVCAGGPAGAAPAAVLG